MRFLRQKNGRNLLGSQLQDVLQVEDELGLVFVVCSDEVCTVLFRD